MKQHQYHVTVQHLKRCQRGKFLPIRKGSGFYAGNHDDIFEIVGKVKERRIF